MKSPVGPGPADDADPETDGLSASAHAARSDRLRGHGREAEITADPVVDPIPEDYEPL